GGRRLLSRSCATIGSKDSSNAKCSPTASPTRPLDNSRETSRVWRRRTQHADQRAAEVGDRRETGRSILRPKALDETVDPTALACVRPGGSPRHSLPPRAFSGAAVSQDPRATRGPSQWLGSTEKSAGPRALFAFRTS